MESSMSTQDSTTEQTAIDEPHLFKDFTSGLIHAIGVGLSIAALVLLVVFAARDATARHVVSFAIYGASLILLYSASTCLHWFSVGPRTEAVFEKLDHIMIFVLIAGTYTPICLIAIRGGLGWTLFGMVWGITLFGVFMKIFWMSAPKWLSTGLYLAMGWMGVIAVIPIAEVLTTMGIIWLVIGGVCYSGGAVIFYKEKPNLASWFNFHDLWHILVLAGSISHWFMMRDAVLPVLQAGG